MRHNVHIINATFYKGKASFRPNVKIREQLACIDLVVSLVVLGIVVTACLVLGAA